MPRFKTGDDIFSDLQRLAYDTKQQIERSAWTATTPNRAAIAKVITCLRRFKEVGDIAVYFDPVHAALPWAVFRFLLEVRDLLANRLLTGLFFSSFFFFSFCLYTVYFLFKPCTKIVR